MNNYSSLTPDQPPGVQRLVQARQLLREGLAGERARANRFLLMCLTIYTLVIYGIGLIAPHAPVILNATPDDQYTDITCVMFVLLMVWVVGYMAILSRSRRWVSVSSRFQLSIQALDSDLLDQTMPSTKLRLAHVDECLMQVERRLKNQLRELSIPPVSLASTSEKIFHTIN